jgi:pathogenesis-related protein 1
MKHRSTSKYGENLYMGSAHAYSVVDGAKAWYREKKYFKGGKLNNKNWYKSGHYTQMVWKTTTELGCGKIVCKGFMILVCNYNPPGNMMGTAPY